MSQRTLLDQYILHRVLGEGKFGIVYKAIDTAADDKAVAIKFINTDTLPQQAHKNLNREVDALVAVQHPNKINILANYVDVHFHNHNNCVLVLELAENGELMTYLLETGCFDESLARNYFHDLVNVIEACHQAGFCHRDIKPENILLDANFRLKLTDFGLSNYMSSFLSTTCGTEGYTAPEVLAGQQYDGEKADIWSLGVILFILLAGAPPLKFARRTDWWYNAVLNGRYDRFWAAHFNAAPHLRTMHNAQRLIEQILKPQPSVRFGIEQIRESSWFRGELLDTVEVFNEMNRRKILIQQRHDEEIVAAQYRQINNTPNVFDSSGVYRSGQDYPEISFDNGGYTIFCSDCKPQVFDNLIHLVESIDPNATISCSDDNLSIVLKLPTPQITTDDSAENIEMPDEILDLNISVKEVRSLNNLTSVELNRKTSDIFAFRRFLNRIKSGLQDIDNSRKLDVLSLM